METVDNVREYIAAMADVERSKEIVSNEVAQFAQDIKNGLGEEIKHGTPTEKVSEGKFKNFIKRLFNTCQ